MPTPLYHSKISESMVEPLNDLNFKRPQDSPPITDPGLYEYTPLNTEKSEIRLLTFESQPGNQVPMRCSLRTYSLQAHPAYHALSYEWASNTRAIKEILVEGKEIDITMNLHDYLVEARLHHLHKGTCLWVDAICIDQNNVRERNHQVQVMGNIFRGAEQVYVWLPNAVVDEKAFKMFRPQMEGDRNDDRSRWMDMPVAARNAINLSIDRIFDASYWHRMWIVQEILLAQKLILVCHGGVVIDETKLRHDIRDTNLLYGCSSTGRRILGMRFEESGSVSLDAYIAAFSDQRCFDLRDKIYALLGLVPNGHLIPVDYGKGLLSVFGDVLRYEKIIKSHQYVFQDVETGLTTMKTLGSEKWGPAYLKEASPFSWSVLSSKQLLECESSVVGSMTWDKRVAGWVLQTRRIANTPDHTPSVPVRLCGCDSCYVTLDPQTRYRVISLARTSAYFVVCQHPACTSVLQVAALGNHARASESGERGNSARSVTLSPSKPKADGEFLSILKRPPAMEQLGTSRKTEDSPGLPSFRLRLSEYQIIIILLCLVRGVNDVSRSDSLALWIVPGADLLSSQSDFRWKQRLSD